jgi:hypothetical protein
MIRVAGGQMVRGCGGAKKIKNIRQKAPIFQFISNYVNLFQFYNYFISIYFKIL